MPRLLNIAIAGCSHGEMDRIYAKINDIEHRNSCKVDLLICCGDFQSVRNHSDLKCMACPPKYRDIMTFYKYYSGEVKAPVLTLFVGGNHEASNYLAELPYGGWVAENIYYMGFASVVRFGGLRILGWTGIYNGRHYQLGHFEHPPFTEDTKRSFYHVRNLEAFRLKQLRPSSPSDNQKPVIDIGFTHDWPRGITEYGNKQQLYRYKPHLMEEAESGTLGSPASKELVHELRPRHWFAAHLHTKFTATVKHNTNNDQAVQQQTEFMALDKPQQNPNRVFLDLVRVSSETVSDADDLKFEHDPIWLAILKSTDHLLNLKSTTNYMPGPTGSNERYNFHPTAEELQEVDKLFDGDYTIRQDAFVRTAPNHKPNDTPHNTPPTMYYRNPQTQSFCAKLGVTDINAEFCARTDPVCLGVTQQTASLSSEQRNPDEIDLHELDSSDGCGDDLGFVIDSRPAVKFRQQERFVAPSLKRPTNDNDNTTSETASDTVKSDNKAESPSTGSAMSRFKRRNVTAGDDDEDS